METENKSWWGKAQRYRNHQCNRLDPPLRSQPQDNSTASKKSKFASMLLFTRETPATKPYREEENKDTEKDVSGKSNQDDWKSKQY